MLSCQLLDQNPRKVRHFAQDINSFFLFGQSCHNHKMQLVSQPQISNLFLIYEEGAMFLWLKQTSLYSHCAIVTVFHHLFSCLESSSDPVGKMFVFKKPHCAQVKLWWWHINRWFYDLFSHNTSARKWGPLIMMRCRVSLASNSSLWSVPWRI